jgi:hypothetical protein
MKSLNQSGIGFSIRRSVSILLMFATLAVTNGAKAADFMSNPTDEGTNISFSHPSDRNSTFDASQPRSGDASLDGNPTLIAEPWALYCVTDFGTFPLVNLVPSGSLCYAEFNYFPYAAYGIAE